MIQVKFSFGVASIEDGEWQHDNPIFAQMLNATRPALGVSAAEPNVDYALAEIAAQELGGTILSNRPPADFVPGRIY